MGDFFDSVCGVPDTLANFCVPRLGFRHRLPSLQGSRVLARGRCFRDSPRGQPKTFYVTHGAAQVLLQIKKCKAQLLFQPLQIEYHQLARNAGDDGVVFWFLSFERVAG